MHSFKLESKVLRNLKVHRNELFDENFVYNSFCKFCLKEKIKNHEL